MLFPIAEKVNPLNIKNLKQKDIQDLYEQEINSLDFSMIKCKECGNTGFVTHGYYNRGVKTEDLVLIRITRIKCPHCNKTHAILPQWLVPYSRIPLETTVEIILLKSEEIKRYLETAYYLADEVIRMIKDKYRKYWRQRLISQNIKINNMLSTTCLDIFGYQFMQIRYPSTIAYRQYHIGLPIPLFSP